MRRTLPLQQSRPSLHRVEWTALKDNDFIARYPFAPRPQPDVDRHIGIFYGNTRTQGFQIIPTGVLIRYNFKRVKVVQSHFLKKGL